MLDYSMKYRAVRKMLDDVLGTLDRTSDFTKLYELSNRVKAKLELMDEMDKMDPPYVGPGITRVALDKEPGEGKVKVVETIKAEPGTTVESGVPGQHGEILDIVRTHSVEGKAETDEPAKADGVPVVSMKWTKDFFSEEPWRYLKIGEQEWMRENLKATDDPANGIFVRRGETFFTYEAAVREAKKYEKDGWRLPTTADFNRLLAFCGGEAVAGTVLKSRTGWSTGCGSDDYGFRALPSGLIAALNKPDKNQKAAYFWSVDQYNVDNAYRLALTSTSTAASLTWMSKIFGYSVRLVRDAKK